MCGNFSKVHFSLSLGSCLVFKATPHPLKVEILEERKHLRPLWAKTSESGRSWEEASKSHLEYYPGVGEGTVAVINKRVSPGQQRREGGARRSLGQTDRSSAAGDEAALPHSEAAWRPRVASSLVKSQTLEPRGTFTPIPSPPRGDMEVPEQGRDLPRSRHDFRT